MKTVTKLTLLFAIVAASFVCTAALGQSKFYRWLRERIGEREAEDAQQAAADALWRKKHLPDATARQKLIAAVKEARCYICHVKDEKKEVRNALGQQLSKALQADLEMDSEAIAAAVKSTAPAETRAKMQAGFYRSLDKVLQLPTDPKAEDSPTYGDHFRRAQLP